MSELTDILIQAMDGNATLVLVLLGLAGMNLWQTRHFDRRFEHVSDRMGKVETRVKRAESVLINGPERVPDGGREIEQEADD